MSFSLLSVAVFGTSAAIVYKETKKGYKQGLLQSLLRLALFVVCAVFSTFVSVALAEAFGGILFDLLRKISLMKKMEATASLLLGASELLVKMVLSLVFYIPSFYWLLFVIRRSVNTILRIVAGKRKESKEAKEKKATQYLPEDASFFVVHDRKLGAAVGILSGLILSVIVFMPLTGLLASANNAATAVIEITDKKEWEEKEGIQLLRHYANDISCTTVRACGGNALFELTTRVNSEGESTTLNHEIETIRSLDIARTVKSFRKENTLTTKNLTKIENMLADLNQSLLLKTVMTDFIRGASVSWVAYQPYFGIERPNLGDNRAINDFFSSILYTFTSTTIDTYEADIRTLINLIKIFEDCDVLFGEHDYVLLMENFVGGDALQRIEDELYQNPHMTRVQIFIDSLVMDIISSEVVGINYTTEQRDILYSGIASVLSDTQGLTGDVQLTAVANGISERFAEQDIYLPENLENRVAEILISQAPVNEPVTIEEVERIFNEYVAGNGVDLR